MTGGNGRRVGILPAMSVLQAHLICVALVAIDLIARTWRIQWILLGLRFPVSFREVLTLNTVGDAAAAVTPLRLGGEPARLAAMTHARVPLAANVVALLIEVVVMWPIILAVGGWLAVIYAPHWWRAAAPSMGQTAQEGWHWLAGVVALSAIAWWLMRRYFPRASYTVRRGTRRALAYTRRMPAWPLLASIPLTLVSVAARVAILPVLALTLPVPPPLGPLAFVSFALLHVQLLLPTPSGAGVVELGFLGGAVGDFGGRHRSLLLVWRFYTTFVLVALGIALGAQRYGREALAALARRRMSGRPAAEAE
jgi:uncharacterized membrane protein YbhN (UPF0104 family)